MKNRKGFALILTVILMMFLSLVALHLLYKLHEDAIIEGKLQNMISSTYIADAGIQDVIANVEKNINWTPSNWGTSFKGYPGKEFPSGSGNGYNVPSFSSILLPPGTNRIITFTVNGYSKNYLKKITVIISATRLAPLGNDAYVKVISEQD